MYVVEKEWLRNCMHLVVIQGEMGHRCGYVGINNQHPLYGVGYQEETDKLKPPSPDEPCGKRSPLLLMSMALDPDKARPEYVFNVHGGVTYSKMGDEACYPVRSVSNGDPLFWYGFDCGHCDDGQDMTVQSPGLRKIHLDCGFDPEERPVRSLEYVIEECNKLSDDLAKVWEAHL